MSKSEHNGRAGNYDRFSEWKHERLPVSHVQPGFDESIECEICLAFACVLSHFNHGRLSATPWTVVRQAPLSMRFSRQEYWSG